MPDKVWAEIVINIHLQNRGLFRGVSGWSIDTPRILKNATKQLEIELLRRVFDIFNPIFFLGGHSKTTLTIFCPILATYQPPVDMFFK